MTENDLVLKFIFKIFLHTIFTINIWKKIILVYYKDTN